MRVIESESELVAISGGEMNCTLTVGTETTVSCSGTKEDWTRAATSVYAALAATPGTAAWWLRKIF